LAGHTLKKKIRIGEEICNRCIFIMKYAFASALDHIPNVLQPFLNHRNTFFFG